MAFWWMDKDVRCEGEWPGERERCFFGLELDPQNMTAAFVCLFGMECGGRKLTENEI